MIHVVFQANDVDVLKRAMGMDTLLSGEVVQIADDFAVGPIAEGYLPVSRDLRKQWWRDLLANGDYDGIVDDGSVPDDHQTVESICGKLRADPSETLWIWAAQNKHDVSGYYWLIGQLKEFQGRIFLLYLHNLPFINVKGAIFYPTNLYNIPPKEFIKAKKLARMITPAEFEADPEEWLRLGNEHKGVRVLEGAKKLLQFDYDFYDAGIKKFLTADWMKASRFIHQYLAKATHITGDAYLLWRIKLLVSANEIDAQGEVKNMKDFEVKIKATQPVVDQQF